MNLQVFLPSITNKIISTNGLIWPNIVRFCLMATCGILPCGGLRVAGVWQEPLYWGTVSYRAGRPTLSNLSAFAGWHQHLQDRQPPPQGHCLHCRLPQGHTNQTMDKHRKVLILQNTKRNIQLFFKPIQIKNSRCNCQRKDLASLDDVSLTHLLLKGWLSWFAAAPPPGTLESLAWVYREFLPAK